MTDKEYCMSSYLAFRYIEKPDANFYEGLRHQNYTKPDKPEKKLVKTAREIGDAIAESLSILKEGG